MSWLTTFGPTLLFLNPTISSISTPTALAWVVEQQKSVKTKPMKIQKNVKWAAAIAVVCLAAYSASAGPN
jgi:hypothetical protein